MKKRLAAGIRKIVGDCFNQIKFMGYRITNMPANVLPNSFVVSSMTVAANNAGSVADPAQRPWLSRAITQLCNTRTHWQHLVNSALSQAQKDANAHVFVQGGLRQRIVIENQEPYPQFIRLYKFVLTCDEASGATEFHSHSEWFDQVRYREGKDSSAVDAANLEYDPSLINPAMDGTTNTSAYLDYGASRETLYRLGEDGRGPPKWFFQFPRLKSQVKRVNIWAGRIPAFSRKTVEWRDKLPQGGELKPKYVFDATAPVGVAHYSYYLMCDTRTPRSFRVFNGAGAGGILDGGQEYTAMGLEAKQTITYQAAPGIGTTADIAEHYSHQPQQSTYGVSAWDARKGFFHFNYMPTVLQMQWTSYAAFRSSGDSLPNYQWSTRLLWTKSTLVDYAKSLGAASVYKAVGQGKVTWAVPRLVGVTATDRVLTTKA